LTRGRLIAALLLAGWLIGAAAPALACAEAASHSDCCPDRAPPCDGGASGSASACCPAPAPQQTAALETVRPGLAVEHRSGSPETTLLPIPDPNPAHAVRLRTGASPAALTTCRDCRPIYLRTRRLRL